MPRGMDTHGWSLTFEPHPTEDSVQRLVQAVRLIVQSSRATSDEPRGVVPRSDDHPHSGGDALAAEEGPR
jgi:hypothetical protein